MTMSISLDLTYVQLTSETDEYIRECETSAEDTTQGYKRKEAQAKAQGAYMLWLRLVEWLLIGCMLCLYCCAFAAIIASNREA